MQDDSMDSKIKKGISQAQTNAGFGVSLNSFHKHTGIDSPRVKAMDLIFPFGNAILSQNFYTGSVAGTGNVTNLPSGWSTSYAGGSGESTVTHNLNTTNYIVVFSLVDTGGSFNLDYGNVYSKTKNAFVVRTAINGTGVTQIGFDFILVVQR